MKCATRFRVSPSSESMITSWMGFDTYVSRRALARTNALTAPSPLPAVPLEEDPLDVALAVSNVWTKSTAERNTFCSSGRTADRNRRSLPFRHTRPSKTNCKKSPALVSSRTKNWKNKESSKSPSPAPPAFRGRAYDMVLRA